MQHTQTKYLRPFTVNEKEYTLFDLHEVANTYGYSITRLPYVIRLLLESLVRQADEVDITTQHIKNLVSYDAKQPKGEIPFKPTRVILQDFTGVPVIVDLASMREAIVKLGGKAEQVNPEIPVDLVIDHSVQVDKAGSVEALAANIALEFQRNEERYEFLKWAQTAFDHYRVIPPATGIIHQVNIEYLSDVVVTKIQAEQTIVYPDSVLGTDSHTTMINGLGVLGWGVGGIEAEAAMLGEPSYFPVPEVVGVYLTGKTAIGATATDIALEITKILRETKVVGKFVEFFGPGMRELSLADRATIANMAPEYGATCGYFPVDDETLRYMKLTGRSQEQIELTSAYLKQNDLYYEETTRDYTTIVEVDLSCVTTSLAGPKRPQDLVVLPQMKQQFQASLTNPEGPQGFGLTKDVISKATTVVVEGKEERLQTGDLVLAAITSCTNTSNPYVMLAAGLLAKHAVEKGLTVSKKVKTSLAPGSQVVTAYLQASGLLPYLEQLGFAVVGYGCTTCIGNSGPIDEQLAQTIIDEEMIVSAVLSGNRNFEGRIHPQVKANYLASPPLVIAYALAGSVNKDLTKEPLGQANGQAVYLQDIWPTKEEIDQTVKAFVTPELYQTHYAKVFDANEVWNQITVSDDPIYSWDEESTYIANPPYFEQMSETLVPLAPLENLAVLAKFGDSVTTDHISPAGAISSKVPAGRYLKSRGVTLREFNSYGSRRGHHEVMMRGTFANIRIKNQLVPGIEGGQTIYAKTGEVLSIYDAAMRYKEEQTGLIILAGKDYGMGSSRDWAAKGTYLLGVKAVIAESYERIHRSNLVMMGVLPLEFLPGQTAETLGLDGSERFTVQLTEGTGVHDVIDVTATKDDREITFQVTVRFDSQADIRYYQNQGILPMVVRKKIAEAKQIHSH
ncbi:MULTISPECIES: aconitate hydratase AcnA [Enterococcus]|uniref:Aconitate hydratase n=1 Tax=Enterococcus sulfureus ATCC 49903 TaxID=1140003 RepID=S0NNX0_9ENTE|nr:aconitate hydratase AcnA [Enterococcus sulfureus]EOT45821.1 aconitate hydratase 1 [Enterococcus sulfureus ATCC 49903]EOT82914.1 aconitate hydratase 1 [Enterococcus sulfureus ATCC 49903]